MYIELFTQHRTYTFMAIVLKLSTVVVSVFHDREVANIINSSKNEASLYVIPVGVPKQIKHPTLQ